MGNQLIFIMILGLLGPCWSWSAGSENAKFAFDFADGGGFILSLAEVTGQGEREGKNISCERIQLPMDKLFGPEEDLVTDVAKALEVSKKPTFAITDLKGEFGQGEGNIEWNNKKVPINFKYAFLKKDKVSLAFKLKLSDFDFKDLNLAADKDPEGLLESDFELLVDLPYTWKVQK